MSSRQSRTAPHHWHVPGFLGAVLDFSPRPSLSPPPSGDRSTPPGRGGGCGGCSECLVPRSRRPTRLCPPGCHLAEGHCGPILTSSLPLFALWTAEEGQTDSQRGDRDHFLLQCMKVKSESEVTQSCPILATPWTEAYQAPPSMGFSRQKYWSGVSLPSLAKRHSI